MSAYTDGTHLVADSLAELHRFARRMRLKRDWYQDGRWPHYDLTTRKAIVRAIQAGAMLIRNHRVFMEYARALKDERAAKGGQP